MRINSKNVTLVINGKVIDGDDLKGHNMEFSLPRHIKLKIYLFHMFDSARYFFSKKVKIRFK